MRCVKMRTTHAGLEFSYNFADYFGMSAALNFGTLGRAYLKKYGFTLPMKFELHYPVSPKILLTASAGVRLRLPPQTFLTGFDGEYALHLDTALHVFGGTNYVNAYADKNTLYADLLLDVGLYYQLPNQDFLRFTTGINMATDTHEQGILHFVPNASIGYVNTYQYSLKNHFLYFQAAYIHSFSKKRLVIRARPHWSTDEGMKYRHEVRFEVGDPFGAIFWMRLNKRQYHTQDAVAHAFTASPTISLNYHYRLTRWLWAGLMVNYAYAKQLTDYTYWDQIVENRHFITIMPELRFSYLNRPHVTLYSALAAGITTSVGGQYGIMTNYKKLPITFSSFQFTALGIRAGRDHLFGTFEAGIGIKGFASLGIGYAF